MRIHILSDLHLESGAFEPVPVDADVTVLAGDTWTKGRGVQWAADAFPDRPVLYLLGNHEYYNAACPSMLEKMKVAAADTNVVILEKDVVEVGGVRFLGCTLWTDFAFLGDPARAMAAAAQGMNDYRLIRVSPQYRKIRPADTLGIHRGSVDWLEAELQETEGPTVVITHHAPSPRSLPEQDSPEILNAAYLSNLEGLILESGPDLWIHGHLHHSVDYRLGGTRVLSNPRGYGFEPNQGFEPDRVMEVP